MQESNFLKWGFTDFAWHHGLQTPSDVMLEIKRYNIDELVQNITTPMLVIDAEMEDKGQAMELYEALPDALNKKYYMFKASDAAQFHDQVGAHAMLTAVMFDWIDEIMAGSKDPGLSQ